MVKPSAAQAVGDRTEGVPKSPTTALPSVPDDVAKCSRDQSNPLKSGTVFEHVARNAEGGDGDAPFAKEGDIEQQPGPKHQNKKPRNARGPRNNQSNGDGNGNGQTRGHNRNGNTNNNRSNQINRKGGNNEKNVKNNNNNQKPNPKKLSHSLSWALRHAAPDLGLTMTPDGFVPVDEILNSKHSKLRGFTLEAIQHVVETNDKQRFALAERPAEAYNVQNVDRILCIRANQGHSISTIDPDLLLTKLSPDQVIALPMIVHGTYSDPYESHIRHEGLKRMNRTHIHFATGLIDKDEEGKPKVISGMRRSCQIYVYLDAKKCVEDGIEFYQSANGVILTAGVDNAGTLPAEYFSHVTGSDEKVILDQR